MLPPRTSCEDEVPINQLGNLKGERRWKCIKCGLTNNETPPKIQIGKSGNSINHLFLESFAGL